MPVQPDQFTLSGYAQNGILDEALRLFNEMPQPNVVSWTAIIAGYAQNEFAERALEIIILSACAKLAAFEQGYVQNGLVNKAVENLRIIEIRKRVNLWTEKLEEAEDCEMESERNAWLDLLSQ
ncbi:hypothetical protein SUGI_0225880 [Cryptomeria japonica]|nr:hypothetical protein SUGI_0225880 [Cryptomeria japonica]